MAKAKSILMTQFECIEYIPLPIDALQFTKITDQGDGYSTPGLVLKQ